MWRILHFFRAERIFKCSNQKSVCITYERSLVKLLKGMTKSKRFSKLRWRAGGIYFPIMDLPSPPPVMLKPHNCHPQPHTIHHMYTHSSTHTHRHTLTAHRSHIPINTPVLSPYMQIHSHLAVAMHAHSQSPTRSHPHNHYPIDTHVYSR